MLDTCVIDHDITLLEMPVVAKLNTFLSSHMSHLGIQCNCFHGRAYPDHIISVRDLEHIRNHITPAMYIPKVNMPDDTTKCKSFPPNINISNNYGKGYNGRYDFDYCDNNGYDGYDGYNCYDGYDGCVYRDSLRVPRINKRTLASIYSKDTQLHQCPCLDTVLSLIATYETFINDCTKQIHRNMYSPIESSNLQTTCQIKLVIISIIPSLNEHQSKILCSIPKTANYLELYNEIIQNQHTLKSYNIRAIQNVEKNIKELQKYICGVELDQVLCAQSIQLQSMLTSLRRQHTKLCAQINYDFDIQMDEIAMNNKYLQLQRIYEIKALKYQIPWLEW